MIKFIMENWFHECKTKEEYAGTGFFWGCMIGMLIGVFIIKITPAIYKLFN
jgi:hypothetical protein